MRLLILLGVIACDRPSQQFDFESRWRLMATCQSAPAHADAGACNGVVR